MDEIDSIKQIPNIFSSRLDEPEKASNLNKLITSIASSSLSFVQHEENIKLLAQLARNIKLIVSEYPENYVKRCRDINYWFNEKIKTYKVITKEDIYSDSTAVFNDILWPKSNKKIVCVQNEKPYSPNNAKLMKELDDYCEIRDNNGCNALKNKNECLKYNSYISGKKKYFSSQIKNICSPPNCNEKDYKIDANCTLNDFDLTFPEINCEFTPVGSIIHRFRRRKYDLKRNIERVDDDRYSSYHSDTMPTDSENKSYYIEYARPHN
ncbi:unnamed protein product [Plasmodium vivax]|uniref:(malaria parasite P. vivax) hypothetical protein n=1 Tax=Plasmodium vivax TaxID=5855 RepID=A0A8S4HGM0_PLAVI|nr:unnamed protein product [Plasmodium vivax]